MELYQIGVIYSANEIEVTEDKYRKPVYEWIKLRFLDIDTGEVIDMELEKAVKAMEKNPELFKNVSRDVPVAEMVMQVIKPKTLILPVFHEEDGKLTNSSSKATVLKLIDGDKYLVADHLGCTRTMSLSELYEKSLEDYNGYVGNFSASKLSSINGHFVNKLNKALTLKNSDINFDNNDEYFISHIRNLVIDEYTHKDTKFDNYIKTKYNEFISKNKLLGMDTSFIYRIDGDDVILISYTGSETDIVIPNFITIIGEYAFGALSSSIDKGLVMKHIKLSNSIKKICKGAFAKSGLEQIDIPESVKIIETLAFNGCSFCNESWELIEGEDFKLLSDYTYVEDSILDIETGMITNRKIERNI